MIKRRDFIIASSVGLVGATFPTIANAIPCPPPTVNLDATDTVSNTCVSTTAPAYVASMSPFEVRAMSGTYSPTNGFETIRSTMPAEWVGNDDILRPWSGGWKNTTGTRLYLTGGGHGDSANNSVVSFDFAGTTRPTGFARISGSTLSQVRDGALTYGDGLPGAVHTYDALCELGGKLYRSGGAGYSSGQFKGGSYRLNLASNTDLTHGWETIPTTSLSAHLTIPDPITGKILFLQLSYGGSGGFYSFYNSRSGAAGTWGTIKNTGVDFVPGCAAYRPDANPATGIGVGSGGQSFTVNWSNETVGVPVTRNFGGGNAACLYDPVTDRFWLFGGGDVQLNTTLQEINPSTWAVTNHAFVGDPLANNDTNSYNGTLGRFVFIADWRAVGTVLSRNGPAYVIRLP